MGKRLFLLITASLLSVILAPTSLMATDSFVPLLPNFQDQETILSAKKQVQQASVAPVANQTTFVTEPQAVFAPVEPAQNIKIAGRTLEIVDVPDTIYDAGGHVNRYGGKFLYGHNTGAVFGSLTSMGVGSVFSVTSGGMTRNYQVVNVVIFEKNPSGKLQINGSGSYMYAVSQAIHLGKHYDLSLMTCYGTSYGNGDASHRLVLFANAI